MTDEKSAGGGRRLGCKSGDGWYTLDVQSHSVKRLKITTVLV